MRSRSCDEAGTPVPGSSCDTAPAVAATSPAVQPAVQPAELPAELPAVLPASQSAELPAELVAVDAATRAALTLATGAHEWDAASRAAVLGWVARHRDALAVLESRVLTAEREAGTWSLRGDRDLAGFLGRTSHQGRGAGLAAVGQAGTLAAMPMVAEALVDGPVTTTHVAQITRATTASPTLATELATSQGQARVVEMAGRLDGSEFGKALSQLAASLDPAGRQRAHDEQRAARSFAWTHTPSGTLLKGRLDTVAGHTLAKAIDALCPRPAVDDERSREQRQADALVALAGRAVTDRSTTPGSVAPVQAVVVFTPETWAALRAATSGDERANRRNRSSRGGDRTDEGPQPDRSVRSVRSVRSPGAGAEVRPAPTPGSTEDVMDRLRGADPVADETGQAWPASEVARALCDCLLTRAVVGGRDAELNLGRGERRFGRQHCLALYAAGVRACAISGCGMPLAYTELHHLKWWTRDGGPTDLANCAAYCSFHHHEIHRLGIVVTRRVDGTLEHHHPDGRPYGGASTSPPPTSHSPTSHSPTSHSPTSQPPGTHPTGTHDDRTAVGYPSSPPDNPHGRCSARPAGTDERLADPGERSSRGDGARASHGRPAMGDCLDAQPPAPGRRRDEGPPADLLELLTG